MVAVVRAAAAAALPVTVVVPAGSPLSTVATAISGDGLDNVSTQAGAALAVAATAVMAAVVAVVTKAVMPADPAVRMVWAVRVTTPDKTKATQAVSASSMGKW